MKLFARYNRINIVTSILIFLAGCAAFYFVLKIILLEQLDNSLHTEQTEIIAYVHEFEKLPKIVEAYDQKIVFTEIQGPFPAPGYSSIKKLDAKEKEYERLRELIFGISVGGKNYRVSITKSQMETEDLLRMIILIAAAMIALILLAGYIINRIIIKRLWRPFYNTINEVEGYELSRQQTMNLSATGTEEFDLLNGSLNKMSGRAQKDYQVLKEFTSNAAHEMQTPLAVIRTNIDSLMQDDYLVDQHNKAINTIDQYAHKLTRLNQALLLMTRIENGQFTLNEEVPLNKLIEEKTNELAELIAAENLHTSIHIAPVTVRFHRYLAEVVISNFINNAIHYNKKNGQIIIELKPHRFTISNTSVLPGLDKEKIYQRFYRHPETIPGGNGLGLSIVKQVCELAGFTLQYDYRNELHTFSLIF